MPTAEGRAQTLYDKVFQDHIVDERLDGTILLYIGLLFKVLLGLLLTRESDRHLVHEVTSPVSNYHLRKYFVPS
jgi:3-isopropylmalate dehydratase